MVKIEMVLTAEQMHQCLKSANAIGREVNEEISETYSNAVEGTVIKVMVAELMLLNLKVGFIELNNKDGEAAFDELHRIVKTVVCSPKVSRGNS
jgi:hypothetical protein